MSVKAELEELVKWISDLTAKDEDADPESLSTEEWRKVAENLDEAVKKYRRARDELARDDPLSVSAELAHDLARQAASLELRARVLAPRARAAEDDEAEGGADHSESKPRSERAHGKAAEAEAAGASTPTPVGGIDGGSSPTRGSPRPRQGTGDPGAPEREQPPAELLRRAQGTVETARDKLDGAKPPDGVAKAFTADLDVLAEMTLSLRLRLEEPAARRGFWERVRLAWRVIEG